jgi:RNA polymerase sigma factor (sigma-70 family)
MSDLTEIDMAKTPKRSVAQAVREYGKRLSGFIRGRVRAPEDAEDILQDVWVQLGSAMNLDEIEQLGAWLFRVARNKIIDRYRRPAPDRLDDLATLGEDGGLDFGALLPANAASPEDAYLRELFWEVLMAALEELPENQRQVFVWNELEDLTLQQIADRTGENLKTVISRKGYAVKHLRKRLVHFYEDFFGKD